MFTVPQLTPSSAALGGANAIATQVLAAVAGRRIGLGYLSIAFSGGVPAAGANITISDGVATVTVPVPVGGLDRTFPSPLMFGVGLAVTVTVPAMGAAIQAQISAGSFNELP